MQEKRMWILQRWASELALPYAIVSRKFEHYTYKELAKPFLINDKANKSYQQLSLKYSLSVQEIRTICNCLVGNQQGNS